MIKKAITGGLDTFRRANSGLTPATRAQFEDYGPEAEEEGFWYYLVTDTAGIRPRKDAVYSKGCKLKGARFTAGTVLEVDRRRRSGWTRWLSLSSGEGWIFDVSPKDRKVRMVEVEVQHGEWQYMVCADKLPVLPRPEIGAPPTSATCAGQLVTAVERVRPLVRRGAFLRLAGVDGWVLDFLDGAQTLKRCHEDSSATDEVVPEGPAGEAELGSWTYTVLDPQGMTLRSAPTYDRSAKLKTRLEEGEIVTVVRRQITAETTFLRVEAPGRSGWAFDAQPGPETRVRLAEVKVETGSWWYRICSDRGMSLRSRCSTAESSKVQQVLQKSSLIRVGQRVKIGDTTFLRLKDESGWVFDRKGGRQVAEGPITVQPMRMANATVVAARDVHLARAPTCEPWAATKMVLLPSAKVQVAARTSVEGQVWVEVKKPGGMQGWVPAEAVELEFDVSSAPAWSR
eukprot:CAMPEP_0171214538 /NCGR_PEP_ID=MMETSP0790-20130122/31209_1 /TAXON_ID=2925 /ORGANISM="Alexandrium catenella, Strain OF101" /LENGTH=454 /DNA_ID=CAMNT_0011680275 /DNA_START=54 /DNA_END=1418 /DNA_ORIENTATION=+